MKHQNTTQRALALRKNISARKRQRGFAMEWIIIVLLVGAAIVGTVMVIGAHLQNKGKAISGALEADNPEQASSAATDYQANKTEIGAQQAAADAAAKGFNGAVKSNGAGTNTQNTPK